MNLTNTGKLIYDQFRKDLKKTHKSRYLIVQPKYDDLDKLYQWYIEKQFGQCMKLQSPVWKCHITVVDPREKLKYPEKWNAHKDEFIKFEYSPDVERTWKFWSLPVKSKQLENIREELGLNPKFNFHITIGREHEWQNPSNDF